MAKSTAAKKPASANSKKPQKINFAKKNQNTLIILVAVLFIAVGVATLLKTYAAQSYLKVCNSSASWHYIKAYNDDARTENFLKPDKCVTMWNGGDNVRVDVDPYDKYVYPYDSDIDAYKIGIIGEGYGPCHNSENSASNPPNTAPDGVRYRTYAYEGC